jgi:hypothetical protein
MRNDDGLSLMENTFCITVEPSELSKMTHPPSEVQHAMRWSPAPVHITTTALSPTERASLRYAGLAQ